MTLIYLWLGVIRPPIERPRSIRVSG